MEFPRKGFRLRGFFLPPSLEIEANGIRMKPGIRGGNRSYVSEISGLVELRKTEKRPRLAQLASTGLWPQPTGGGGEQIIKINTRFCDISESIRQQLHSQWTFIFKQISVVFLSAGERAVLDV